MPQQQFNTIINDIPAAGSGQPELSGPVQEIISSDPGYLVRHGTAIIMSLLLLLLAGSWLIRYPDILEGAAIITTDPLPIKLKPATGGRITKLFLTDGTQVTAKMPIAEIENATGYENIRRLRSMADSLSIFLKSGNDAAIDVLISSPMQSLGEGQAYYNQLLQQISTRSLLHGEQLYHKRTRNLEQQISNLHSLSAIGNQEKLMTEEELRQSDERFKANEQLYREKVISRQEYHDEAARLRQKKMQLEQQKKNNIQNNISASENNKQMLELQYEREEKERALNTGILEALRNIMNYIQEWERTYLLLAPFTGTVQYMRPLQVNEPVTAGEELFAVIPARHKYSATVMIPVNGAGKVQARQKVHLLLENFPYNEFGMLEGSVIRRSTLPELPGGAAQGAPAMYRVTVSLPDSLVTTSHKKIPFSPEMAATARIITKDRNLLQRFMAGVAKIEQ